MKQNILTPGKLLNDQGKLDQAGYAYQLVKTYNRKAIKANPLRIKEWDYYLVANDSFGLALTVADNSYMSLLSATFLNFKDRTEHTFSPMSFFTFGKLGLPSSSESGDIHVKQPKMEIQIRHENNYRHILVSIPNFNKQESLQADILLTEMYDDTMVIATPYQEDPKAFYYNQKIIGMKAEGTIQYNDTVRYFDPENSYGILDWGRGVWTYENTWYWSAANGKIDNDLFGFNLGYGFGDTSQASENMLFYQGKAHKLDRVQFLIPGLPDGQPDYMKPWTFASNDGRFESSFDPILDRSSRTKVAVLESDQHQVFGYFNGRAILDDQTVVEFKNLLGFAEKVHNKW